MAIFLSFLNKVFNVFFVVEEIKYSDLRSDQTVFRYGELCSVILFEDKISSQYENYRQMY